MVINLNGAPCDVDTDTTVAELLQHRQLADQPCAVEVNQQLVQKRDHGSHELHQGDTVEIVTLVGGG